MFLLFLFLDACRLFPQLTDEERAVPADLYADDLIVLYLGLEEPQKAKTCVVSTGLSSPTSSEGLNLRTPL